MSNEAKFYFIHLYDDYSGSPRVLSEMINAIDVNKVLITSNSNGILSKVRGVEKKCFYYKIGMSTLSKLFYFLCANMAIFFILFGQLLRDKFKGIKSTVIINTMLPFGALIAAGLFRNKAIVYLHETSIKPAILKKALRLFISKFAGVIIYVSRFLRDAEDFQQIKEKIVIYNPVSPQLINNVIDLKHKYKSKNVVFLSSLVPYKGIDDYIKIADSSSVANDGVTFNLVLNSTAEEFLKFKNKTLLPNNIRLFNRPDNLKEIYFDSGIVLNLSNPNKWVETFGLTLAEGMSNGLVPIGPKIGGPAEIIVPGCGFCINHDEHDAILMKINYLFNNEEEYKLYASNSMAHSKIYSMEHYINSLHSFFGKI
jgi:glycosyltransferase involved in cell wall biosynthesis